jgi:hypothetical protein
MNKIDSQLEDIFAHLEKLLEKSPWTTIIHKIMPDGDISITSGAYDFQMAKEVITFNKIKHSDKEIEDYAKLTNDNAKIKAQNSIAGALLLAPLTYKKKVRLIREDHSKYDLDKDELRNNADKLEFSEALVHLLQLHKDGKTLKIDSSLLKTSPILVTIQERESR